MLLQPKHGVSPGPDSENGIAQERCFGRCVETSDRRPRVFDRGPCVVPPGDPRAPVAHRESAEELDPASRRAGRLPERVDGAAIDSIVRIGVAEDRADAASDFKPVHLRHVKLGAAGSQEHRVGEGRVVVDVRKGREANRIGAPDQAPQLAQIARRGGVASFVLCLRVNDQALGARVHGTRAGTRLGPRLAAVDILPGAHVQTARAQLVHEAGTELRPVVPAVGALDDQR